ncbi:hypothetical protein RND81_10G169400 [Saponaria officinalis]|uniref:Legumain prodomain domain-containing protein n=1 Tax=Saponaria officinalis TaxID=3572 RepID=A0AAW1I3U3_SAPOF
MSSQNIIILIITMVITLMFSSSFVEGGLRSDVLREFSDKTNVNGTKWAVLIAGSSEFWNYRHQADICHAYHILKQGGLKDENIIVFMYDDIAYHHENPKPGVIINNPKGKNVYPGVPKDYTGANVSASNIFAVILGNKKAIKGGSGKMLKTKPNDHIFIYYADHGGPGILGMPSDEMIYANDFVDVLKKKHASKSYKNMVIYVEACESGSIFDGLLPKNLSIYVTTASKPDESSYACYCDGQGLPEGYYHVCLGDLYSVAWMEDSEQRDMMRETLEQQFITVRKRTGNSTGQEGSSHAMQYGDLSITNHTLSLYIGADSTHKSHTNASDTTPLDVIEQRDADLFYLRRKVERAEDGSEERINAQKQLDEEISRRKKVDQSVASIGRILFGEVNSLVLQSAVRPAGQPLVDDWDCFKSLVKTYEEHCGPLRNYGRKYLRNFANMCNAGSHQGHVARAASQVCTV